MWARTLWTCLVWSSWLTFGIHLLLSQECIWILHIPCAWHNSLKNQTYPLLSSNFSLFCLFILLYLLLLLVCMWSWQNSRTLILCLAIRCSCNGSCKSGEIDCAWVAVIIMEKSCSQCSAGSERPRVSLRYNLKAGQVLCFQGGGSEDHILTDKAAKMICSPYCSKVSPYKPALQLHFARNLPEFLLRRKAKK